jgi:threonine/homoserine/homoserine lactone efflux protein
MFGIQSYASFVAAILMFQLVPGPGTIAILNAVARNGIGAGLGAVAGTLTGDFIYMVAAYLCWLGFRLLRNPVVSGGTAPEPKKSGWVYFRQAFAVSLTNPKVVLFFVSLFPLFLQTDAPSLTLGIMMAHVTVISFLYQAGLVLIGNAAVPKLSALPSARKVATRLAGAALIGFGVKFVLRDR